MGEKGGLGRQGPPERDESQGFAIMAQDVTPFFAGDERVQTHKHLTSAFSFTR